MKMEGRFPHIFEQIFEKLDDEGLTKCREVSRSWKSVIDEKKFPWIRIIKIPRVIRNGNSYLHVAAEKGQTDMFEEILLEEFKISSDISGVQERGELSMRTVLGIYDSLRNLNLIDNYEERLAAEKMFELTTSVLFNSPPCETNEFRDTRLTMTTLYNCGRLPIPIQDTEEMAIMMTQMSTNWTSENLIMAYHINRVHTEIKAEANQMTKGEFSIELWYALVKIAPSVYESVRVF